MSRSPQTIRIPSSRAWARDCQALWLGARGRAHARGSERPHRPAPSEPRPQVRRPHGCFSPTARAGTRGAERRERACPQIPVLREPRPQVRSAGGGAKLPARRAPLAGALPALRLWGAAGRAAGARARGRALSHTRSRFRHPRGASPQAERVPA